MLEVLHAHRGGRGVTSLVDELGWPQPQVSKHLGVLRRAGLVSVERSGRQRVYRVNGEALRPAFDWLMHFEEHWDHAIQRIKERAERLGAMPVDARAPVKEE